MAKFLVFLFGLLLLTSVSFAEEEKEEEEADNWDQVGEELSELQEDVEDLKDENFKDSRLDRSADRNISVGFMTRSRITGAFRNGFLNPFVVSDRILPVIEMDFLFSAEPSSFLSINFELGTGTMLNSESIFQELIEDFIPLYVDVLNFTGSINTDSMFGVIDILAGKTFYDWGSPLTFLGIDKRQQLFERVPWQRTEDDRKNFDRLTKDIPTENIDRFASRPFNGFQVSMQSIRLPGDMGILSLLASIGFSSGFISRNIDINLPFNAGLNRNFYLTYGHLGYANGGHKFKLNYAYHNMKVSAQDPFVSEIGALNPTNLTYKTATKFENFVGSISYEGRLIGMDVKSELAYSRTDDHLYDILPPNPYVTPVHKDGLALTLYLDSQLPGFWIFQGIKFKGRFFAISPTYFAARSQVINTSEELKIMSVSNSFLYVNDSASQHFVFPSEELGRTRKAGLVLEEGLLYNDRAGGTIKFSAPTNFGAFVFTYGLAGSFGIEDRVTYAYHVIRQGWFNHLHPGRGLESAPILARRLHFETGLYTPFGQVFTGFDYQYQGMTSQLFYDSSDNKSSGFTYLAFEANLDLNKVFGGDGGKFFMINKLSGSGVSSGFSPVPYVNTYFSQMMYESTIMYKITDDFYILGLFGIEHFWGPQLKTYFDDTATPAVKDAPINQLDINLGVGLDVFFTPTFAFFFRFNLYTHYDYAFAQLYQNDTFYKGSIDSYILDPNARETYFNWSDPSIYAELKFIL